MAYSIKRYHDISCGHRVVGHEGKCRNLHGHNYRITFHCRATALDTVGRVIDFGVVKAKLCMWVEENWDHRFLLFNHDPLLEILTKLDGTIVEVPFNPTAENLAMYLVNVVGPMQLRGSGVQLFQCDVEETRKCTATYTLPEETRTQPKLDETWPASITKNRSILNERPHGPVA